MNSHDAAPFRDLEGFYRWAANLAYNEQDLSVELRGPKGRGKSALEFWMSLRIDPEVTPDDLFASLCYSHDQFVGVYRRNDALRKAGHKGPLFVLADDATRLLNKRRHASRKNQAVLDVYRTMRARQRAIMFWLTQDDLLESPIAEGGNYVLIEFTRNYVGTLKWPVVRKKKVELVPMFEVSCPNPKVVYPKTWSKFQRHRDRLTAELTDELLAEIADEQTNGKEPKKTKKEVILEMYEKKPDLSSLELAKEIAKTGVSVSSGYVREVLSTVVVGDGL